MASKKEIPPTNVVAFPQSSATIDISDPDVYSQTTLLFSAIFLRKNRSAEEAAALPTPTAVGVKAKSIHQAICAAVENDNPREPGLALSAYADEIADMVDDAVHLVALALAKDLTLDEAVASGLACAAAIDEVFAFKGATGA